MQVSIIFTESGAKMGMKNKIKIKIGVLIWGVLFCIIFWGGTSIAAEDDSQKENQVFDIDAQLLSSDNITYDIQLTVRNQGEDWEGTVRVQMDIRYDSLNCAYDTVLALPQGSTKQFVVRIPISSVEEQNRTMKVLLLDKNGNVTAKKDFGRFLMNGADALSMGILSDSYQSLTYLDMGGESVYYGGIEFPIHLMELNQDNLMSSLDVLSFLVIDNYNTSVLTDEALESIAQWVMDGGMLIVGTGERAEDTLSGLDFFEIECVRVNEPGESVYSEDYGAGLEQLSLAELKDRTGRYYTEPENLIMVSSWGDGAVEFVPYALSDLGQPDRIVENWESYVWELLQNANNYVRILSNNQYNDAADYIINRIFRSIGNGGSHLNFSVLKLIVILYVIFVGPILYLILRAINKRDWYWAAVPVSVIVGILLVYFAGRGFEVVNTRVYSVTVENLGGHSGGTNRTYLHCYDADYKEWGLKLTDRYDYAGPMLSNYYSYYSGSANDSYHYHIRQEGDQVFFGMNPEGSFEDGYFLAGTAQKMETGSITSDLKTSGKWGIAGTVTNTTSRDFKYFAVIFDDMLFVYDNLPAGETRTLEEAVYTSRQTGISSAIEAVQDYVYDWYYKAKKDYNAIVALGTGIASAYISENYSGGTMVIGITDDWDKTVDDDCSETAYGCLYAVQ